MFSLGLWWTLEVNWSPRYHRWPHPSLQWESPAVLLHGRFTNMFIYVSSCIYLYICISISMYITEMPLWNVIYHLYTCWSRYPISYISMFFFRFHVLFAQIWRWNWSIYGIRDLLRGLFFEVNWYMKHSRIPPGLALSLWTPRWLVRCWLRYLPKKLGVQSLSKNCDE